MAVAFKSSPDLSGKAAAWSAAAVACCEEAAQEAVAAVVAREPGLPAVATAASAVFEKGGVDMLVDTATALSGRLPTHL